MSQLESIANESEVAAAAVETVSEEKAKKEKLPEARALSASLKRTMDQLSSRVERTSTWKDAGGYYPQVVKNLQTAIEALAEAVTLSEMVPDEFVPPAVKAPKAAAIQLEIGSFYMLRGTTAKQEQEAAQHPVKLIDLDTENRRARILTQSGDKIRIPMGDLAASAAN